MAERGEQPLIVFVGLCASPLLFAMAGTRTLKLSCNHGQAACSVASCAASAAAASRVCIPETCAADRRAQCTSASALIRMYPCFLP